MDKSTRTHLTNLWSDDRVLQNDAFFTILKLTDQPVNWAYEAWDELLANLIHKDNHNRAIAAQVASSLFSTAESPADWFAKTRVFAAAYT